MPLRRPQGWPRRPRWLTVRPHEALVGAMAAFVAVFGRLATRQHRRFGTFGFDMGIFDQGTWLLSRFREPFVTVRGLHYFGNHVNLGTVLFVPFYWLGAGPVFLSVAQAAVVALGAVPIWLLARDRLENGWLALAPAVAYLLYPAVQWIPWWHFHPDAMAITPLLFAYWFASRRRWRPFAVAVALTLIWKEDTALAVAALGLVLVVTRRWKAGVLTIGAGAAWFLFCTEVVIPWATDGLGPFYGEFYAGFEEGGGAGVAGTIVRHPSRLYEAVTDPEVLAYYRQLFVPVALLALFAPLTLLIGVPHLLANTISSHALTHDIRYQYSAMVTVAVFLATVEAFARLTRSLRVRVVVAGVVLVASVVSNVAWSPSPVGRVYETGIWVGPSPAHAAARRALAMIPPDAAVSATYQYVPHLTHRELIYEFPNPWVQSYWGVRGENKPDPRVVEYLMVETNSTGEHRGLYTTLVGPYGEFEVVYEEATVALSRRKRAGASPAPPPGPGP